MVHYAEVVSFKLEPQQIKELHHLRPYWFGFLMASSAGCLTGFVVSPFYIFIAKIHTTFSVRA